MNAKNICEELPATPASLVVPADAGTTLQAFNNTQQIKLSSEQTSGALSVFLNIVPPGGGPPPHIHRGEDELFMIIEGQFRFLVNEQWTEPMGAGALVYSPRGARHTFQNVGDGPGRFWGVTTPGGFEQFFAKCSEVFAQAASPDTGRRLLEISAEHRIEYAPPLA